MLTETCGGCWPHAHQHNVSTNTPVHGTEHDNDTDDYDDGIKYCSLKVCIPTHELFSNINMFVNKLHISLI